MMPRKRLKLVDKNIDENDKALDFEPPSIVQHLDILPPEILEKIFEYLSPEHLVLIQYSCNSRVAEATALKKADFSDSKTSSEAFLNSFFTAIRNSRLQELYLPQMIYIDGQSILKYVSRCKFLTKLNIAYKGLSYIKILHILEKCKTLKELHCYISSTSRVKYKHWKTTHNLKKICLNIDIASQDSVGLCLDLLSRCDTEAEVYLNFADCTSTFTFKLKHKEAKKYIADLIITVPDKYPLIDGRIPVVTQFYQMMRDNFLFEDLSYQMEEQRGFCVSHSKIYPIFIEKKTSDVLSILPATPLQTLVFIDPYCTKANEELERKFFENLTKKASLKSLKHLTVVKRLHTTNHFYPDDINRVQLCPLIVPDIFSKCSYLQEVVFSRIHFDRNCPSLFSLKHLKTLQLPPCAITPNGDEDELAVLQFQPFLEDLAENCKHIESFSLRSCYGVFCCRDTLTDEDLIPIRNWSNLKHLMLTEIEKIRTCSFLPRVAANTNLTTLCLSDVGPESVCHYGSNLCYAIKLASNLKFLKICQAAFNPSESLFWKNIAEIKTLEGLCISSSRSAQINSSWITNSVEKLKRLHLFHLVVKISPECLRKNIRKVLLGNGIQNPDIHIENSSFFSEDFLYCKSCHYPFIVPPYHHCV